MELSTLYYHCSIMWEYDGIIVDINAEIDILYWKCHGHIFVFGCLTEWGASNSRRNRMASVPTHQRTRSSVWELHLRTHSFDVVNPKPHPFLFWVWSFSLPRMLQLGTAKSAKRACPWESHPRFLSLETFMGDLQLRWFDSRFFWGKIIKAEIGHSLFVI